MFYAVIVLLYNGFTSNLFSLRITLLYKLNCKLICIVSCACDPYCQFMYICRMTIRDTAIRAKTEGPEPAVNPEESLESATGVLLELYTPEDTARWEAAFNEHIKYINAMPATDSS